MLFRSRFEEGIPTTKININIKIKGYEPYASLCDGRGGGGVDYGLWTTIGYGHSINHMYSTQFTIFCISITFDFVLTIHLILHYNTLRYVNVYFIVLAWYVFMCISFSVHVYYSNIIISYHRSTYTVFILGYTTPTRI